MDTLLLAFGVLVVAALAASLVRSVTRWCGASRGIAIGVAVTFGTWLFKLVVDLRADPTSHNLWPIEAVGMTLVALLVLGTCALLRASARTTTAKS